MKGPIKALGAAAFLALGVGVGLSGRGGEVPDSRDVESRTQALVSQLDTQYQTEKVVSDVRDAVAAGFGEFDITRKPDGKKQIILVDSEGDKREIHLP